MAVNLKSGTMQAIDPGFRRLSIEIEDLTVDLAVSHATMQASPTEREKSDKRVEFLTNKMLNGLFLTPWWVIAQRKDGTKVRINGQHTSTAVVGLDGQWEPGHKVVVETYEVDSPEAEAALFRQIDTRQSGRSAGDVCGAYQGLFSELGEADKKVVKLSIEAFVWYERRVKGLKKMKKGDDRYELLEHPEVRQFALWTDSIMTAKTKELRRPTVFGAMYSTWKANPEVATVFWQEAARGNYDDESRDPAIVLGKWLLCEYGEPSDDVGSENLFQGSIYCWNMHRAGKEITAVKYAIRNARFLETAE